MSSPNLLPCRGCGLILHAAVENNFHNLPVCYDCNEAEKASRKRRDRFAELCPPSMLDLDLKRLPGWKEDRKALEKIVDWEPTPDKPLLILHGPTGRGKTRIMWRILQRHALAPTPRPRRVVVFGPGDLSAAVTGAWHDLEADEFLARVKHASFVAFDDLDKDKQTTRAEEAFFAIIAHRCDWGLPTIITTNLLGRQLVARMSSEMREAILRRVSEFSTAVSP